MRKVFVGLMLISMASTLHSCSNDPEWADPELHDQSEAIIAKYRPLIIGDWYRVGESDSRRDYIHLRFNADSSVYAVVKMQRRDTVMVGGKPTVTDWRTVYSDSTRQQWYLYVTRNETSRAIETYLYTPGYLGRFDGISGDTLKVTWSLPPFRYLLRGDVKPRF